LFRSSRHAAQKAEVVLCLCLFLTLQLELTLAAMSVQHEVRGRRIFYDRDGVFDAHLDFSD
jgi:hypothetical protein